MEGWSRNSGLPTVGPVSYTHLVIGVKACGVVGNVITSPLSGAYPHTVLLTPLLVEERNSVSYTHLDVYKRQFHRCLRFNSLKITFNKR